ncbi:hypothetical protein DMW99_15475 [Pseudomonas chlororaphis]|nr:hypothetical protein DMW99_15475 [Pseudomonas chlororaphis]
MQKACTLAAANHRYDAYFLRAAQRQFFFVDVPAVSKNCELKPHLFCGCEISCEAWMVYIDRFHGLAHITSR